MDEAIQLVCPHCDTINRLSPERSGEKPVCGRCKKSLFPGEALELTAENFDRHRNHTDLPLLVDFWAPWCGPCRTMGPVIAEAARLLEPDVRVAKLNTDAETTIAARYAIRSIPTLGIFVHGQPVQQRAGAIGLAPLLEWVRTTVQSVERKSA